MLIKQLFVYDYLGPVLYIQYHWGMDWPGVEIWRRVVCAVLAVVVIGVILKELLYIEATPGSPFTNMDKL